MTTNRQEDDQVRDVLLEVVDGADALDEDTLAAIARGEPVHYDVDDTGAAYDLTQLVSLLQIYVPIIAGMVSIAKGLYDLYVAGRAKKPTAEEIVDAFVAKYGVLPDEWKEQLPRIARAVAARNADREPG
ncbi:hypothetical protein [Methylobacterium oryzisoli]|uniref:hypothetical protein n=1 Tax=Methylobacterium oryzisoli TaxID=3385502 RepID=UPI003892B246